LCGHSGIPLVEDEIRGEVSKGMITKEKFEAYVGVQMSGVTNMFNVPVVMSLSGLSRTECLDIMENYGRYREQFKKENANDKNRE
jgi:hypothetical protein